MQLRYPIHCGGFFPKCDWIANLCSNHLTLRVRWIRILILGYPTFPIQCVKPSTYAPFLNLWLKHISRRNFQQLLISRSHWIQELKHCFACIGFSISKGWEKWSVLLQVISFSEICWDVIISTHREYSTNF